MSHVSEVPVAQSSPHTIGESRSGTSMDTSDDDHADTDDGIMDSKYNVVIDGSTELATLKTKKHHHSRMKLLFDPAKNSDIVFTINSDNVPGGMNNEKSVELDLPGGAGRMLASSKEFKINCPVHYIHSVNRDIVKKVEELCKRHMKVTFIVFYPIPKKFEGYFHLMTLMRPDYIMCVTKTKTAKSEDVADMFRDIIGLTIKNFKPAYNVVDTSEMRSGPRAGVVASDRKDGENIVRFSGAILERAQ